MIFNSPTEEANDFYLDQGYVHYRINNASYKSNIDYCFNYYSDPDLKDQNMAFKNAEGKARHFIDVFRDKDSKTLSIYQHEKIKDIVKNHILEDGRFNFTHSKMSFKQIGSEGGWYPHQDNGYKNESDIRDGFAMFVCLEDMDESNGALQVYPESNKIGILNHDRLVEDASSGDSQLYIKDENIPPTIKPLSIIASKGDIILFSANTIHKSLSTKSNSKRLSLIAEIEEYKSSKLDDYGKTPIFVIGSLSKIETMKLKLQRFFNPSTYWALIKKNQTLSLLVRRLKHKLTS